MINFTDVQSKLQSSDWKDEDKTELALILPRLGEHLLSHIDGRLSEPGSFVISKEIIQTAKIAPEWYSLLEQNKGYQILDFVRNYSKVVLFDPQGITAIIRDIKSNKTLANLITADLYAMFDCFEIDNISQLQIKEIAYLLEHRAVQISALTDLEMEIKRYCYLKSIEDPSSREMQLLKVSLQGNAQSLGSGQLTVKESSVNSEVKYWIELFLDQGVKSADRSIFNVANFMAHDTAVQALNLQEKKAVSDILKLFNWFYRPMITDSEIENFNDSRRSLVKTVYLKMEDEPYGTPKQSNGNKPREASRDADLTPMKSINEIAKKTTNINYNGEKPPQTSGITFPTAIMRRGLATGQKTNIDLDDEQHRLEYVREEKRAAIQQKLEELRKRKEK